MIEALRAWMISIILVSFILSLVQALTPEGGTRKMVSLISGLLLLLVMLQPLTHAGTGWQVTRRGDIQREVLRRTEELQKKQGQAQRRIIEERTAAYISKEAKRMGISCTVRVKSEMGRDGVPRPASAALSCPPSKPLSAYMEHELGIAAGRQTWNEKVG